MLWGSQASLGLGRDMQLVLLVLTRARRAGRVLEITGLEDLLNPHFPRVAACPGERSNTRTHGPLTDFHFLGWKGSWVPREDSWDPGIVTTSVP